MCDEIEIKDGVRCSFFHVTETPSTNDLARAYAKETGADALFLADRQTHGRGRADHVFQSPKGGLYFSYLFHPEGKADGGKLTVAAAVAVLAALREVAGVDGSIKWVNDIFANGKKIAGILAEGETEKETFTYAVIGVGVNLADVQGIREIADIATSAQALTGKIPDREALITRFLRRFYEALQNEKETMKTYRENCFVIGKMVTVSEADALYEAYVADVTDEGSLLLCLPDGKQKLLRTGEVRVKIKP